jgi:protein involved in polysaccharide export with SLBB domain
VLPVKGLNIPFEDVALSGGEVVEVESLPPQVFSVMGLVNKPGSFAFPPNGKFNLTTALALAGGLDEAAGPRYARVYRQDKNGKVVSALFMVDDDHLAVAANVFLKPGDIVAVEQTSETKFRKAMSKIGTGLGGAVSYSLQ